VSAAKPELENADFTESDVQMMARIQGALRGAELLLKSRSELSTDQIEELRARVGRCQVLLDLTYVKTKRKS
jgi:hypothetical protein